MSNVGVMKSMKKLLCVAAILTACASASAFAGDVGVSITVDKPGLFGRLDIGGIPGVQLVFAKPMLVAPPPFYAPTPAPIYLHVPPGYERHWRMHCRQYDACGRPVYFVRDRWYNDVYVPTRREHRDEDRGRGHYEHRNGDQRERDRHEDRGRERQDRAYRYHGDHGDRRRGERDHEDRDHGDHGDGGDHGGD